ncbi:MAG: serine/threonine-protein kinase [Polyangiales bacterium]
MQVTPPSARLGSRIAGKYQLIRVIGEGGMGAVYEARHVQMDRRVAIKMLRPELVRDRASVERFLREAQTAAHIEHKSIVRVFDFGEAEDGTPFIVMTYLDGHPLSEALYRRGRLSELDAVQVLAPIASALDRAHRGGVIHRDLKPENIFMARDSDGRERPVLLDFGVARLRGEADAVLPEQGGGPVTMLGTPAYMAPEQLAGDGAVDARTDIYGMGVVLYELLTGVSPFQREDAQSTIRAILTEGVRSPSRIVPAISPAMEAVILCAMARDPQHRFESMEALQHALQDVMLEPQGSAFVLRYPLARAVIQARASEPAGSGVPVAAGAEHADNRQRTMMLVVGSDGTAKAHGAAAPAPTKPAAPSRAVGIVFAVVLFLGGAAMLAFALLRG